MSIISLEKVSLAFGHRPLLKEAALEIESGQRICIVGRNGEGKSTLLKVIQGTVLPDDGSVWRKPKCRIATLEQTVPEGEDRTVFEVIADALQHSVALMTEYNEIIARLEHESGDELIERMGYLQHELDAHDAWHWERQVELVISQLEVPRDAPLSSLSGGYKRRVLLGRALVGNPDLLLLDEPTNHLDVESVQWLEDYLLAFHGAIIFVTHDRTFLQNLATDIVDLDRGVLRFYPGDYQTYKRRQAEQFANEATQNALFDKKLAQEEVWIRQGIKARRTRNEGRVRALQELRSQRTARLDQQSKVKMQVDQGDKSGKLVVELDDISYEITGKKIISHFSAQIQRGDRIGILGPNGIGKSTLLKIILGQLEPQSGVVKMGTRLEVAYFDQQRALLDPEKTVIDNLNHGSDFIEINGQSKHIIGYLQDFLFAPQRARSPVKSLSGGECNRLLLARLFLKPANVLVLDEPTNDLDVETLELLEDLLIDYKGTVLLVSHDRTFLDNVVTSTLVFEGDGKVREFVGGFADWKRQIASESGSQKVGKVGATNKTSVNDNQKKIVAKQQDVPSKKKPSYKVQRELDSLPAKIEELEKEKKDLEKIAGDPGFYKGDQNKVTETLENISKIQVDLDRIYQRWEELEA